MPFATTVAPLQRNGRTLLPMRDIFEELGASSSNREIAQLEPVDSRPRLCEAPELQFVEAEPAQVGQVVELESDKLKRTGTR